MVRRGIVVLAMLTMSAVPAVHLHAWGGQGHRLVALLATERLTPMARRHVLWLLGPETLADVCRVESTPRLLGKRMTMLLAHK